MDYTLNIHGRLQSLSEPHVMGILNATPDSFYAASREQTDEGVAERVRQIVAEGARFIDVGACSTRPGSAPVSEAEETARLRRVLPIVRREAGSAVVSIDTFRPAVACMAVEEYGVDMVNDVSPSEPMFRMVSRLRVPYIIMSQEADIERMLLTFARQVQQLRDMGQKDIIIDPGFGFGKSLEQNFSIMNRLERLQVLELPLLVGVSRKSMIYKTLETTPEEALNGTTAMNTVALLKGADILRVHDVAAAVECVKLNRRLTV